MFAECEQLRVRGGMRVPHCVRYRYSKTCFNMLATTLEARFDSVLQLISRKQDLASNIRGRR
jgi:hypothetical protein